jgi:hypothetical protein
MGPPGDWMGCLRRRMRRRRCRGRLRDPSGHPEQTVTLNASTVGSGPVGTLDATLVENGGYFIALNATN